MKTEIESSSFRGIKSVILTNDCLRAEFLPGYGSKLASLQDCGHDRDKEFLFQPSEGQELKLPGYGADFAQHDASGFDEMFPTIDASFYPRGRWAGRKLPDHGELWSVPWQMYQEKDESENIIGFTAESRVLPCRLNKRVSLQGNQLQLEYNLQNKSDEKIDFIWAAHPLFAADRSMEIVLPENIDRVINVEDSNPHLGSWGKLHSYPLTESQLTGEKIDLSSVPGSELNSCRKYYVPEKLEAGYCALKYPREELLLELTFPESKVPYLGVWKSLGGFRGDYNIALEPCTGAFDDLYLAHRMGKAAVVEPESTYEWWLNFTIRDLVQ